MQTRRSIGAVLAIGVIMGCGVANAETRDTQSKLMAEAKVGRPEATKAALTRIPDGTVKSVELEKEHGALIWSFDITRPGTRDVSEVHVDAMSGKVLSVETETPAQERSEGKDATRK